MNTIEEIKNKIRASSDARSTVKRAQRYAEYHAERVKTLEAQLADAKQTLRSAQDMLDERMRVFVAAGGNPNDSGEGSE